MISTVSFLLLCLESLLHVMNSSGGAPRRLIRLYLASSALTQARFYLANIGCRSSRIRGEHVTPLDTG